MAQRGERRRRLIRRWEALEGGQQSAIAFPVLTVLLFLLHLGPLNQPLGRSIVYALFWAVPATAAVVIATAHERRKRDPRDGE
jgi:hypothetical protein